MKTYAELMEGITPLTPEIKAQMSAAYRNQRMNIRNFYLTARRSELEVEIIDAKAAGDVFRAQCLGELLKELEEEEARK